MSNNTENMQTGPDIDRAIANIMGWKAQHRKDKCDGVMYIRCGACGGLGHGNCYGNGVGQIQTKCADCACRDEAALPEYSRDMAKAWEVAERLRLTVFPGETGWFACQGDDFLGDSRSISHGEHWIDGGIQHMAHGETAALAICRSALMEVTG